eukprot:Hpha_TRINITY_DN12754_c0_g2::TRINITY_DN12754_c0_g2_i2::g.114219::m.114219
MQELEAREGELHQLLGRFRDESRTVRRTIRGLDQDKHDAKASIREKDRIIQGLELQLSYLRGEGGGDRSSASRDAESGNVSESPSGRDRRIQQLEDEVRRWREEAGGGGACQDDELSSTDKRRSVHELEELLRRKTEAQLQCHHEERTGMRSPRSVAHSRQDPDREGPNMSVRSAARGDPSQSVRSVGFSPRSAWTASRQDQSHREEELVSGVSSQRDPDRSARQPRPEALHIPGQEEDYTSTRRSPRSGTGRRRESSRAVTQSPKSLSQPTTVVRLDDALEAPRQSMRSVGVSHPDGSFASGRPPSEVQHGRSASHRRQSRDGASTVGDQDQYREDRSQSMRSAGRSPRSHAEPHQYPDASRRSNRHPPEPDPESSLEHPNMSRRSDSVEDPSQSYLSVGHPPTRHPTEVDPESYREDPIQSMRSAGRSPRSRAEPHQYPDASRSSRHPTDTHPESYRGDLSVSRRSEAQEDPIQSMQSAGRSPRSRAEPHQYPEASRRSSLHPTETHPGSYRGDLSVSEAQEGPIQSMRSAEPHQYPEASRRSSLHPTETHPGSYRGDLS